MSHATRDSNDEAQELFQRAIALDPSYAAAYAALGLSLIEAVSSGWTEFRKSANVVRDSTWSATIPGPGHFNQITSSDGGA